MKLYVIRALMMGMLLINVLAGTVSVVEAQVQPHCPDDQELCESSFQAGNQTHTIRYARHNAHLIQAVHEVTERSVAVYQPLFGELVTEHLHQGFSSVDTLPFSIVFMIQDTSLDESDTYKGRELASARSVMMQSPDVHVESGVTTSMIECEVRIYPPGESHIGVMNFVIAHEIAHCYQFYYIHEGGDHHSRWWIEGAADWLATLVYPHINNLHDTTFIKSHRRYMFLNSYDNAYFWLFLASPSGLGNPQLVVDNVLALMPRDDTYESYSRHLRARMPDLEDVFERYSLAVAFGNLLHQPPIEQLYVRTPAEYLPLQVPFEQPVGMSGLSVKFVELPQIRIEEDVAMLVRLEQPSAMGVRAHLIADGASKPIEDDGVVVCPEFDTLHIALSRVPGTETTEQLMLVVEEVETDECQSDEDGFPDAGLPACIVGTWDVVALPPDFVEMGLVFDGPIVMTYAADGTWHGSMDVVGNATAEGGQRISLHMEVEAGGRIAVAQDEDNPQRYNVLPVSTYNLYSASVVADFYGQRVDMTPMLTEMAGVSDTMLPLPIYYLCKGPTTLTYSVGAGGGEEWIYRLRRR